MSEVRGKAIYKHAIDERVPNLVLFLQETSTILCLIICKIYKRWSKYWLSKCKCSAKFMLNITLNSCSDLFLACSKRSGCKN